MRHEVKKRIMSLTSQAEIGRKLDCAQQTVCQWLNQQIPSGRVIPLCTLLNWQVTPHELRPDLHPTPASGIPEGVILPSKQESI